MQSWHTTYLGLKDLPRELSAFELQAFFTYSRAEREVIDARYGAPHKLGLALHMGFLRLSGRSLSAVRIVPVSLWTHLGKELGVRPPELASLKAMYARGRTLFDHRQLAQDALGFRLPTEHQNRAFLRVLRDEAARLSDKDQLLVFARRWLYDHKLLIENNRGLRTQIVAALDLLETQTGELIAATVPSDMLDKWRRTLSQLRPDGQTQQSWLWEAPAKHSTVQIAQVFERIDLLYSLDVHQHLGTLSDLIVRRYARQLANRPPSVGARIKEPRRTVEVACFLRYCLFTTTDQAILMIQRRVTDLWRMAREEVPDTVNWAVLYKKLVTDLAALTEQGELADDQLRQRVVELVQLSQQAKPPSRASLVRERLFEGIRPVRSLLAEIGKLPWQVDEDNPVLAALKQLLKLYADKARELPIEISAPSLGRVWSAAIAGDDRDKAMRALEVATLFSLRRAVRNGSVWVDHSLVFRGRARWFCRIGQLSPSAYATRLSNKFPITPCSIQKECAFPSM
jgi:hypothetical protein